MSLKFAILGFLKNSPKTGYDLQKKIETTISHFWMSTQSQIYRTLKELSDAALIESEIQYQDQRPNKKVYSITKLGEEELIHWLSSPIIIPGHRNHFLVQLFFSKNISEETMINNLEQYRRQMEERLNFLNTDEIKRMLTYSTSEIEGKLFQIIRNNGVFVLQAEIDWVNDSIQFIKGE